MSVKSPAHGKKIVLQTDCPLTHVRSSIHSGAFRVRERLPLFVFLPLWLAASERAWLQKRFWALAFLIGFCGRYALRKNLTHMDTVAKERSLGFSESLNSMMIIQNHTSSVMSVPVLWHMKQERRGLSILSQYDTRYLGKNADPKTFFNISGRWWYIIINQTVCRRGLLEQKWAYAVVPNT